MTSAEFQSRYPKPWCLIERGVSFTLRAANGAIVGHLDVRGSVSGLPLNEKKRHIAAVLSEIITVSDDHWNDSQSPCSRHS